MNIANIFGLYLGCKVRFEGTNGVVNARIEKVDSFEKIIVTDGSFQYYVDFKDCKLLLTPLDKITEEDKREFQDKFLLKNRKIRHFQNTMYGTTIYFAESEIFTDRAGCNNEMAFWLASKGYDIGICPIEYKEVTE